MRKGIDYPGISVVFICHDGEGNYLSARRTTACRDEHGRWEPGSGGLDLHDSVIGTLYKEIQEEYGTEPLEYEFLGYRDMHRMHEGSQTHWVGLDFKVRLNRAMVQNMEPHKHDELRWTRIDQLPEPRHSQFPDFLERYRERL